MSVKSFFESKKNSGAIEIEEKKKAKQQAKLELTENLKKMGPVMEQIYSVFNSCSKEIKKNKYTCTLYSPQTTDLSSQERFTSEIVLGGVWKEKPSQPKKEVNIKDLMTGFFLRAGLDHKYEKVVFTTKTQNDPTVASHSIDEINDDLVESYIEKFLNQIIQ